MIYRRMFDLGVDALPPYFTIKNVKIIHVNITLQTNGYQNFGILFGLLFENTPFSFLSAFMCSLRINFV